MWPWDHVALAYVCYSLYVRFKGERPSAITAMVVVTAALAPDIIDKPLAWWVDVLPSGRSLGHSAFTALAASIVAVAVERRVDVRGVASAVAIGLFSHLAGDVAYPLFVKGDLRVGFLLWPVVPAGDSSTANPFEHISELFAALIEFAATTQGTLYLVADALLLLTALALWVADGAPGTGFLRAGTRKALSRR